MRNNSDAPVIAVRGLRVVRGSNHVIEGLDLTVPAGQVVGLLGPSGSGKTTLMRAIVGAQLVAGTLWVNCFFVRDLRAPFGGSRHSGVGREGGTWSFDFYCDVKNTCTNQDRWIVQR